MIFALFTLPYLIHAAKFLMPSSLDQDLLSARCPDNPRMSNIYEDIQWVHNVLKYEISYPLLIRAVSRTLVIYETGLLANKLNKPFSDQLLKNPISSQLFEDRFSFGTQFFYAMFLITFLPIFMLECFQIAWSDIFLSSFCLLFHLSIYIYFFSFFHLPNPLT